MAPASKCKTKEAGWEFLFNRKLIRNLGGLQSPKVLTLLAGCLAALSPTWWLIPLSRWVITPVISGLTLLIPFITGVITHLRFVGSSPPSSDSYPSVIHGDFPIEMFFFFNGTTIDQCSSSDGQRLW